jgi:hypothetical protein
MLQESASHRFHPEPVFLKHFEKISKSHGIFMHSNRPPSQHHGSRAFSISWQGLNGLTRSAQTQGVELSRSGIGLQSPEEVQPGMSVYIQDDNGRLAGYATVRHCSPHDGGYFIGLELDEDTRKTVSLPGEDAGDYYEFLQISPKAEPSTITRVYRFLAARYHPDNSETGDPEKFLLLNRAYDVLSHSEHRAAYDAIRESKVEAAPGFESVDFMDGVEGELNRRLAVLSLLYRKCRADVENPKVTLADLETLMAFPREYLDFTTWYLRSKKYITREDNSDFALTVLGVDYVESNYAKLPLLRKFLNAGSTNHKANGNENGDAGTTRNQIKGIFMLGPGELTEGEGGDAE